MQVNVNAKGGSRQRTPLHYASLNGNVDIAQLLLSAGANEFSRDSGGYTPLNLSFGGEMCKLLHKVNEQLMDICICTIIFSFFSNHCRFAWQFRVETYLK